MIEGYIVCFTEYDWPSFRVHLNFLVVHILVLALEHPFDAVNYLCI
jgi:hypothetical protein